MDIDKVKKVNKKIIKMNEEDYVSFDASLRESQDKQYGFRRRLQMLAIAATTFDLAWEDLKNLDYEYGKKVEKTYPLNEDFGQIVKKLSAWRESIVNDIIQK